MPTVVSGIDGNVTFANGYDACPTSWTVNFTAEDVDTTCLSDTWRKRVAGLKRWSGTFVTRLDDSITAITDASANSLALGTSGTASFQMASGQVITGTIKITGADVNLAVESGAGEVTISFTGDGAPSIT